MKRNGTPPQGGAPGLRAKQRWGQLSAPELDALAQRREALRAGFRARHGGAAAPKTHSA